MLVENPVVKWLAVGGSGVDHLGPWNSAAVTVTNTAGAGADMMAEYVLGAMLSFSLGLRGFFRQQQARQWIAGKVEPIEGATLLILGLGHTGCAVARRAKAMGMVTLGVRARPRPTAHVDEVHGVDALPGLWGHADFIVCSVPLLAETRGLVGADAFAAMKPGAVLIDVSRGGVVDEAALIAALDGNRLKGAALDVFATEPLPADHPLWGYDNVIITPHSSSVYDGWDWGRPGCSPTTWPATAAASRWRTWSIPSAAIEQGGDAADIWLCNRHVAGIGNAKRLALDSGELNRWLVSFVPSLPLLPDEMLCGMHTPLRRGRKSAGGQFTFLPRKSSPSAG